MSAGTDRDPGHGPGQGLIQGPDPRGPAWHAGVALLRAGVRAGPRAALLGALLGAAGAYFGAVLPRARLAAPDPTPIVYDRSGAFLAQFGDATGDSAARRTEYGFWPVPAVPPRLVLATLAAEDRRFWHHPGIDAEAVLRAGWQDLSSLRRRSGASTIAMQVARMQHPEARTLWAKAVEAGTALALTARFGRDAVLAQYLRLAPYGNGSHGISHAARWYFGKPAADLSWAEIALLCALPRAPAAYNPLRPAGLRRARARAARILGVLLAEGALDRPQYEAATAQLAVVQPGPAPRRPDEALHPILRLGAMLAAGTPAVPGEQLTASLDLGTQRTVAALLRDGLRSWRGHGAQQAAVMVVERATGAVLAAVGSDRYGGPDGGAIDFTRAIRSPGSTLKPFLYAAALQRGLLQPAEMQEDSPGIVGSIRDADSLYLGPLPPGQALANSRNIPAAALLRQLGLDAGFDLFRQLGVQTQGAAPESLGLAMAIGAMPTSLDRLLGAYTALASDGVQHELQWFPGVGAARRVFATRAAREVALFLSDPMNRLPSFARYGSTEYPFPVAVKTGTSQGFRDGWTVAWSRHLLVGAWVGRPDNLPMAVLGGADSAAELVRAVMLALSGTRAGDLSDVSLPTPASYVPAAVCAAPAAAEGARCSHTVLAWVPPQPAAARPAPDTQGLDAQRQDAPVRLSILTPEQGEAVWRDPDTPPAASRLLLRARTSPRLAQIVWYVDGKPFALADPGEPVAWPLQEGRHRFQIGLPLRPERSAPVSLTVH